MPLSVGDRLGPYEVVALIGKGGMGEVYRARDPRLNRDVAIKVSAAQFSERFEREAKAIAALNHPNICQIYDVGPNYLVMEFIEGQSPTGPMPLDGALRIARQIADALEAAHDKGITHRDLKPGNIKIKPDGTVKVLDFGLAKVTAAPSASGENSPTLTMGMTQAGMILGTAAYMAPEQARGKESVDKRADIWAFGVVLYELLTGKRLFEGEDVGEILAKVIRDEPDLSDVPTQLTPLLKRCLEKDPKKRLRDIGDMELLLANTPIAAASAATSRFGKLPWIAAAVLAIGLIGVSWIAWRATRPIEQPLKPLVRLDVDLGADLSLPSNQFIRGANAILSPDGTRLVYVSQNRLFTRRLEQLKATELAGTEGAYEPFFSPDGQWVAFFAGVKLKKISVEGGSPIALCDANGGSGVGGSWGEDGNIVAALNTIGALSRIPSSGGTPVQVTELQGEVTHRWPQILPGGKAVLFTTGTAVVGGFDGANIEVMSLDDHRRKTLQRGGTFGRYLPTSHGAGHLVYINNGTLFAVPFDLDTLAVRGTPAPVLDQVAYTSGNGSAKFDISRGGTLVYESGGAVGGGLFTVQWLNSAGKAQPLLASKADSYLYPRLSPDGQRLAVSVGDIWIYEWQRDTMTRLTFSGAVSPVWSPDGRYIVFRGPGGMFWTRSDGAGKPQPLTQSKTAQTPYSFTPDGKRLAFHEVVGAGFRLWTVPLESDGAGFRAGKPEVFLQTQFNVRSPYFSPDGRWLAYASDESGVYQVYVRAFPDKGGKWQVSNNGGVYPVFSRNGRELFFRTEDNQIMVAAYTGKGDLFAVDKPRVWSEKKIADTGLNGINYDVEPDGNRIAALMPVEAPETQKAQNHVVFLENFFDELRRRVPTGE
jgi:Tol biopolymer transport system component/tRNA A-37 threonylcarbamoyl transferase component Bud32